MLMDAQPRLDPAFIQGTKGPLFALHHPPQQMSDASECIVTVPSFAEEMNRCRYMQTLLAQALNKQGHALVSVDPYGTGDSAGDFAETSWDQWIEDTVDAVHYAKQLGYQKISLLAIRLGTLLAMAAAPAIKDLNRIILWQPAINGKASLNQFLRIKIAASMGRDEKAETTAHLEQLLKEGNSIEVAGYDVSPALFYGIQAAHYNNHLNQLSCPIAWFSVLASAERKTPRGDLQAIEKLQHQGINVDHRTVVGPAFWQAHERTLAPELITATMNYINGDSDHE
jgi:exosortase A-associated hydrolase 2